MPWRSRNGARQRVPWRARAMQAHQNTRISFSNPPEHTAKPKNSFPETRAKGSLERRSQITGRLAQRSRHRKAHPGKQLLENRVQIRANRRLGVVRRSKSEPFSRNHGAPKSRLNKTPVQTGINLERVRFLNDTPKPNHSQSSICLKRRAFWQQALRFYMPNAVRG